MEQTVKLVNAPQPAYTLSKFASGILVQLMQQGDSFCEMSTSEQMKRVGCATRVTYYKALNELVSNGHITLHMQPGERTRIIYSNTLSYSHVVRGGVGGNEDTNISNKEVSIERSIEISCLRNLNKNNPSELVSEIDRERGSIPDAASILNSDVTCIPHYTGEKGKLYTHKTKTIQVPDENYTPSLYTLSLDTVLASNPLDRVSRHCRLWRI